MAGGRFAFVVMQLAIEGSNLTESRLSFFLSS